MPLSFAVRSWESSTEGVSVGLPDLLPPTPPEWTALYRRLAKELLSIRTYVRAMRKLRRYPIPKWPTARPAIGISRGLRGCSARSNLPCPIFCPVCPNLCPSRRSIDSTRQPTVSLHSRTENPSATELSVSRGATERYLAILAVEQGSTTHMQEVPGSSPGASTKQFNQSASSGSAPVAEGGSPGCSSIPRCRASERLSGDTARSRRCIRQVNLALLPSISRL
jgi:hypothetical protein